MVADAAAASRATASCGGACPYDSGPMGRRRPNDWVNWRLYRRAWIPCVLALLVVIGTSFRPQTPPPSQLPPTFTNEQAQALAGAARAFDMQFADRRPGRPGALDSAEWVRGRFEKLGLDTTTVPATTVAPGSRQPVSLVNVEGELPGRTSETVVVLAHRDNGGPGKAGNDPLGTAILLRLAEELAATRDRRRTYLLVSTDGATINGGGARALATRLERRSGRTVAIVAIDRLGAGVRDVHVPISPSGRYAAPLGLAVAAREAVRAERGDPSMPGLLSQLLRLGTPVTLYEHGQLLQVGLPVITLAGDDEQPGKADARPDPVAVGAGVRSLERLLGTIDAVESLQSAGKTHILGDQRVYRGWSLKILLATMLLPFWVAAVDMFVRLRRRWNVLSALGTVARSMIAGIWAVAMLWLLGAVGLLPRATDRPPNPDTFADVPVFGLLLWLLLATAGWLLARGPDWRRSHTQGRDHSVLVVGMLVLGMLSALALAVNPYIVLYALPSLHAWLWLASRRVQPGRDVLLVWAIGWSGPLLACLVITAAFDLGAGAPWYWLGLLETRTLPPLLGLLAAAGGGVGGILYLAASDRVARPALPRLRRVEWSNLRELVPGMQLPIRVPDLVRRGMHSRRDGRSSSTPRPAMDHPRTRSHARARSRRDGTRREPGAPRATRNRVRSR